MNNAADVQVMTGPSASLLHHGAAAVQGALGVDAVAALGITLGLGAVALGAALAAVGVGVQRWLQRGRGASYPLHR